MIAQIRAELLKIRSTRTTVGLILGMIALILLFTLLTGLLSHPSGLASKEDQRQLLSLGSLAGVFSALAGVLLVTSEYRFGTIRPTFLFNPDALTRPHRQGRRRRAWPESRSGSSARRSAGRSATRSSTGVASRSCSAAATSCSSRLEGSPASALWGAIGVGVGAIIHNQVGAVITLLAWGLVVDHLLFGLVPSVGRFVPARVLGRTHGPQSPSSPLARRRRHQLIAWAGALGAIGIALSVRQDIN